MLNKCEIQMTSHLSYLVSVFLVISTTLTACISEPNLEYPEPKQDFATYTEEPAPRSDATLPPELPQDQGLDMNFDQEVLIDQNLGQPTLHTQSLDFVGQEQSTYNDVEPRIIGRYLWVVPHSEEAAPKTDHQSTRITE